MNIKGKAVAALMSAVCAITHAQDQGDPACGALLCMSSPNESSAPHQCRPYVEAYFDIKVYRGGSFSRRFDPVRTAQRRYETILEQCDGARREDRDRVHVRFGHLEHSPFHFN